MLKLTFVLRRRAELSREEFQAYWLNEHGPLVRSHADALGVRRYVQTHTVSSPLNDGLRASREAMEEYDGVAELWWDDHDAFVAASSTPEGLAAAQALLEDERGFIDLERSALWVGEEHVIVDR